MGTSEKRKKSKARVNPCGMPMLRDRQRKYAKEMDSQTGRWIISNIEYQESKRPKYFKNKGVVNGVRGNKIVGDFVLTLIAAETDFMGAVGTETKM